MSQEEKQTRQGLCHLIAAGLCAAALASLPCIPIAAVASDAARAASDPEAPPAPLRLERATESYRLARQMLVLEDPAGTLGVDAVSRPGMRQRFRPAAAQGGSGVVNFGYSNSAYWFAIALAPAPDAPPQWKLEVGFSALDRVDVYLPRQPDGPAGGFDVQTAGDLQPFSERPFPHRNLVFPVTLTPGTPQTLYLRVASAGSLTVPVTLWQPAALQEDDQQSYALMSLYYGMLLALLLYNLLLYLSVRDTVFLAYAAFVASMAIGTASLNGLGNQFLWPEWPAWGNIALPSGMSAAGLFGALFTRSFLNTRNSSPRLDRLIVASAAAFAISAVSPLFMSHQFTAILTSLCGLVFAAIATAGGVVCQLRGHPGARYFLLAWTLLLAGVAILAMRNLGWVPTNAFTVYSMQIGSALEMLLLSFALADRINVMRREKELATQEALLAKESMLETLRRSEAELETRVAGRTRELEEANARLMKNERELEFLARHDALTGLPNRALLNDRVEHAVARARRSGRNAAVLMVDMDGFKFVNDLHGHAVGDQMLQAVAERLAQCVRQTDTVARFGGDEFVILLEDLLDRNDAVLIADKLIAAINEPFELTVGAVRVGVSVGIAYFPRDAPDSQQLLKRADMAMYAAKTGGRNRWQVYAAA